MAFGEIEGVPEGARFSSRRELFDAGVHRQLQAGIAGPPSRGAESIVLSGGYEDDLDEGDWIVYTGQGGQDPGTRRQVRDQELTFGNLGLTVCLHEGIPVRVIRGSQHESPHSPRSGFRYEGLYYVDNCWFERGRSGFKVWRFLLRKKGILGIYEGHDTQGGDIAAERRQVTVQRIVRASGVTRSVKSIHSFHCQVCNARLDTASGPYAEGAHIRPLGRPHNGADRTSNVLCLCPNHHVLLDFGAFTIGPDWKLWGVAGELLTSAKHVIEEENVNYHREHIFIAGK
jgi:putative restriction endonuclease